ncbi:MAG: DEAD/DEAH box helicase [Planctomycetaceae bacterium]
MSFSELGLAEPLLRAVVAEGYTLPTPIQSRAIPHLIAGRDLLGCAQTGTGKTAAYALPVLQRLMNSAVESRPRRARIRALVLSPTRELALQIADSFKVYGRHSGVRHTVVYGGVSQDHQTRALRHGVEILVATPGRLVDLMEQGYIDLSAIEIFVLDEADRMLDMGFLPDVRHVISKLPARRQTVLLSATMPEPIVGLANSMLQNPARVEIKPIKATAELIDESVCFVTQRQKPELLVTILKTRNVERALIFTRTKHGADRVVRHLSQSGIRAQAIHGNKSQSNRQRALADFKTNRTRILVATDIAARGIDVDGISHVLNYDLPHEPETYIHRIGRTGRAGASGIAVSFCDDVERKLLKAIERLIGKVVSIDRSVSLTADSNAKSPTSPQQPSSDERPDSRGFRPKSGGRRKAARSSAAPHGAGRWQGQGGKKKRRQRRSATNASRQ